MSGERYGSIGKPSAADTHRERAGLAARRVAMEILIQVESRAAFANVLLGARLPALSPADRRLATRLVLGTVAWRGRLDYEIEHFVARSLSEIDLPSLQILRMGLFQLRFLDRIPKHAAVDTAVELAKIESGTASRQRAGFVNAVMRRAAREVFPLPDRSVDEAGAIAVEYSHPRWMVESFIQWFGKADAESLLKADNEAAPNTIRINLARASREEILRRFAAEGVEIDSFGQAAETVILKGAPPFNSDCFRDGLFLPQTISSQIIPRMLGPREGATVADCAAAPGGKATHLAELVGTSGRVLAIDVNLTGLGNTRRIADRLQHKNIQLVRADVASVLPPIRPGGLDYVLLDAPCTGLGTMRAHPDIRWRVTLRDSVRISALQQQMLANCAQLVRPGGAIVYSVCTISPLEGEQVAEAFLRTHPEFTVDRDPPNGAEYGQWLDEQGYLRTRPDRGGLDGFFAARLIRKA